MKVLIVIALAWAIPYSTAVMVHEVDGPVVFAGFLIGLLYGWVLYGVIRSLRVAR